MKKAIITQKQGVSAIVMFIIGSSVLMIMGLESKMNIWAAILIALAASTLIMLIYARLMSVLPGKDFYEVLEHFFGKVWSKVIIALLTWFCFDLCAIVLRNFGQFVVTVGLPETPLAAAFFIMIVVCALAVRSGGETLMRWNEIFVFLVGGFLLAGVLLVSPNMDFNNLQPAFDDGFAPIAQGAFGVITFPFDETVVFLLVFNAFAKNVSAKKVYLRGLLIGGGIILITSLTAILVLGTTLAENMYYPMYSTMSAVHFGDFLQRFEVIAAIVFILSVFLKVAVLLIGASKGVTRLLGFKDHRFIIYPIMFLVVNFALFSFDSMIYFHEWTFNVFPYYSVFFEVLIPLVVWIVVEVKVRKEHAAGSKKTAPANRESVS